MAMNRFEKYFNRVGSYEDPVSLQVAITDFCLNKCDMCGHHERELKHHLELNQWLDFLSEHRQVKSVCYSGGDPLVYPYINEVMEWHIDNNVPFGIITAGHIPSFVNVNNIAAAQFVAVSLDAINPTIYHHQRGGKLTPSLVKYGITRLLSVGTPVKLGITVTPWNIDHIPDILDYALDKKFKKIVIHPPYDDGSIILPDYRADSRWVTLNIQQFAYHDLDTNVQCTVPYYHAFISARGNIYHCCRVAGDTCKESLGEPLGHIDDWAGYLKNREVFASRWPLTKLPVCDKCQDRYNRINHQVHQLNTNHIFY